MPKLFDKYVAGIKRSNRRRKKLNPYAVATAALQKQGLMKKGTHKLTRKGRRKNASR